MSRSKLGVETLEDDGQGFPELHAHHIITAVKVEGSGRVRVFEHPGWF